MRVKDVHNATLFVVLMTSILAGTLYAHDGNRHPSPTATPTSASTAGQPKSAPVEALHDHSTMEKPMNMVEDFPNYHPLVVHFPIVLLIFAALFQLLSFFMYRKEFSAATFGLLFIGAVTVWLSSNTFHAHPMNLPEHVSGIFETHELMAKYTWWLALASLAAKAGSHFFVSRKWWSEAVVLILLIGASITVSIAGHHGAQLVHMGGVGPQGKYLESH